MYCPKCKTDGGEDIACIGCGNRRVRCACGTNHTFFPSKADEAWALLGPIVILVAAIGILTVIVVLL